MPQLIASQGPLDQLIDRLLEVDRYALDTEFLRERTYWPDLALIQVAWPPAPGEEDPVALIDPAAVDVGPLRRLLAGPGVLVAHAADQDLEVLYQACQERPGTLFDTQVAAGFLGHGSASLSALASTFLHLKLPKADRLTDWSIRPLSGSQLSYAAADVAHLLDLADVISTELAAFGRLGWAGEECEIVRLRSAGPSDPTRAWWRLREARQLRGPARGVAQEVAAWRELRAREVNQPVRFVLPDLALQAIVHGQPQSAGALKSIRGLDGRHLRGEVPGQILDAIDRGRTLSEVELRVPPVDDVDRDWRPAVSLAAAW
ncbi:MAG: HRDC domain-containing protein, partial [Actinomycetota bacterium]|nr:HRDC domain-containing protein [Actinomycetota bacterium]